MTRLGNSASGSIRLSILSEWALGVAFVALLTTTAGAQGFGPDPFRPYNSNYDAFIWPVAPQLNYGFNSAAMRGVRGANQYQSYLNSLTPTPNSFSGRGGAGTPYFKANRKYDREFGRVYRPNEKADRDFDTMKERSTELYFKYLRATDAKQRSELFRAYNQARSRSDRALSSSRANARPGTRASRIDAGDDEAATTDKEQGDAALDRDRDNASPRSTDRLDGRSIRRQGAARSSGSLGPAPPLTGRRGTGSDLGPAPSPSEILDRALRSDRERSLLNPRRGAAAPSALGPPPPTP